MILLTAVIVLLVSGFSVVYLGVLDDRSSGGSPLVDANVTATDQRVSVTHVGGEMVPLAELDILVSRDAASERYGFDGANVTGDGDDRFSPGDRFRRGHGLVAGPLQVRVIHTPSNAVVHHAYLDARPGSGGRDGGGDDTSPTASFVYSPSDPDTGTTVTFDASDSAADLGIAAYEWDLDGDGSVETGTDGPTVEHAFDDPGTYPVTLTVTDGEGKTDETSRSIVVGGNAPSITSTNLTDGDDDLVTSGESVSVSATIDAGSSDVETVIADASAFDAGDVSLTDGNDDGTYDATFEVGGDPVDGGQRATVEVSDANGNTASIETEDSVVVDATAPDIETFVVADDSEFDDYFFYWRYVERFDVEWSVADGNLAGTTVTVDRSGSVQSTYSGSSGQETYENTRIYARNGREHVLTIVATDAAGNSACRTVTDVADGTDPPEPAYEGC